MSINKQPSGIPYPLQRGEGVYLYHYPRFDALEDQDDVDDVYDDDVWIEPVSVVVDDDVDDWDDDLLPGKYDRDLMGDGDDAYDSSPRRVWTTWRIIAMILILLAMIALIASQFYGVIVDPIRVPELPPPPTSAI